MSSYEVGNFRTGSPHNRRYLGLRSCPKPICWGRGQARSKASDSLLLILKWDRPMVCLTRLGVTVLIFHRSSFLCSQGSFSTGGKWGGGGRVWRRAGKSWWEEVKDGTVAQPSPGRQVTKYCPISEFERSTLWGRKEAAQEWGKQRGEAVERGKTQG